MPAQPIAGLRLFRDRTIRSGRRGPERSDPDHSQERRSLFQSGAVLTRLGLRDRALQDYDADDPTRPRIAAAYAASARLREEEGQRHLAIHDFDMALQLDPKEVSFSMTGNTRRESGDWRGVLADYDRAVVFAPQKAGTYVARGWSRFCAGVEGADFDALVYLKLKGWRDSFSPYMAMLAALALARRSGPRTPSECSTKPSPTFLLALAGTRFTLPAWRAHRDCPARSCGQHPATSRGACVRGLDRLRSGDRAGAVLHLQWARNHGSDGSIALDIREGSFPAGVNHSLKKADELNCALPSSHSIWHPAARRRTGRFALLL